MGNAGKCTLPNLVSKRRKYNNQIFSAFYILLSKIVEMRHFLVFLLSEPEHEKMQTAKKTPCSDGFHLISQVLEFLQVFLGNLF